MVLSKQKPAIIHTRSVLAAFLGWPLAKIFRAKLLFDIRGFAIDEKVDNGRLKKDSALYRFLRKIEGFLYNHCHHLVTLTHASKKILIDEYKLPISKITVIPTCANKNLFYQLSREKRASLRIEKGFSQDQILLLHPGTINRYAFEKEVELFVNLHKINPLFHFIILNENERTRIQQILNDYQLSPDSYTLTSTTFKEMLLWINIVDAAIFFPKFSYATEAMAPTKFAEVVACYVPTITSKGTGDLGYYMSQYNVGLNLELLDFGKKIDEYTKKVQELLSNKPIENNYHALFSEHFDKTVGVTRYNAIYTELG
jgi:glycosyltransferase involved in cell wall biosynthesis